MRGGLPQLLRGERRGRSSHLPHSRSARSCSRCLTRARLNSSLCPGGSRSQEATRNRHKASSASKATPSSTPTGAPDERRRCSSGGSPTCAPAPTAPAPRTRPPRPRCWRCGLPCEERFFPCLIQKALWLWFFLSSAVAFQASTAGYEKERELFYKRKLMPVCPKHQLLHRQQPLKTLSV